MLRLLIGPAGAGKTAAVLEEIRRQVLSGVPGSLMLVPEQYSHEAERELCRHCGDSLSRYAEVLSFTGLARRVLASQGGAALPLLDKGGRLLCMTQALSGAASRLRVYGAARRRAELPELMLTAVDELKSAGITAERLGEAAGLCGDYLGDKLSDAALVLEAYEAVAANGRADPADRLTRLAEKLAESGRSPAERVYIDGFIDFTQQERSVIRELLRLGAQVTVCLTLDDLAGDNEIFALSRRAARQLLACARELGVETRVDRQEAAGGKAPALSWFIGNLFGYAPAPYAGENDAVSLYRAESLTAECEFAAARTLALVRDGGCRWRDIAIAVRGFEDYRPVLESVFRHYGVPLFVSRKSDLLSRPLPALIAGAYEILEGGWDVEDVTAYLRTGLTGLSIEECDTLENYLFKWQLRAGAWERRGAWKQHPDGYGAEETEESRARLAEINELRRRVARPLLALKQRSEEAATAAGQAAALAAYLEALRLPQTLARRSEALEAEGRQALAGEYRQLWDIIVSALEQSEAILGETEMDRAGFGQLFARMLSQYEVGTIPVSLDRVSAGDFDRMRRRSIRHLIVLGASDQRLPMAEEPGGLFSEEERRRLLELQIDLGAGEAELWREFSLIYHVLSLPSESLSLCCPLADGEGEALRPAFVFSRAAAIFRLSPHTVQTGRARLSAPGPALTLAAHALRGGSARERAAADYARRHWPERCQALERAAAMSRGRLSPQAVEALYGRQLRLSASRIDRFASCQFAYFCQYGLRARPYEPAGFTPPEIGSFLHAVLEAAAREVKARGGFAAVSDGELREITRACVADYVREELNDFQEKTPRFVYLFRRLSQDAERIVADMAAELRRSDFEPLDFELDFSRLSELPPVELGEGEAAMTLTGVADRVDGWIHGGELYLRVVDYKTGRRKFSLSDVWYGMGLQMLLYLFALQRGGETRYGLPVKPGGVMYVPARSALLSLQRDLGPEETEKKRAEELRRSGLVLDDAALLEAWEHGEEKQFIPVRFRSGRPVGGGLASAERLGLLSRHIRDTLTGMARQLRRGSIAADPYYRSQQENACLNCDYFDACHFADGENGESCRYLPRLSDDRVWGMLEEVDGHA